MPVSERRTTRAHTPWKDLTGKVSENILNLTGYGYQIDFFFAASGASADMRATTSQDNGATFDTGATDYNPSAHALAVANGTASNSNAAAAPAATILPVVSTNAITWAHGQIIFIPDMLTLTADCAALYGASTFHMRLHSMRRAGGTRPNAIQLLWAAAVTSGRYRVTELL